MHSLWVTHPPIPILRFLSCIMIETGMLFVLPVWMMYKALMPPIGDSERNDHVQT